MNSTLKSYRDGRVKFLSDIIETLSNDERFVAGWLTGSFGRGDEDSVSDIDLSLVVSDAYTASLCKRLEQVTAQTSPERYSLFSQFGWPALIHENNNNAPEGGTFTFVLYSDSAVMVDWVLRPQSKAKRPVPSRLLFDHVGIPPAPLFEPENIDLRKKAVAEQWAFFWMMTAITTKYILRNDGVFATEWIEHLYSISKEIERWLAGEPWSYVRSSLSQLQPTRQSQLELLRGLCRKMQELKPKVTEFTGTEPLTPVSEIEILFTFVEK